MLKKEEDLSDSDVVPVFASNSLRQLDSMRHQSAFGIVVTARNNSPHMWPAVAPADFRRLLFSLAEFAGAVAARPVSYAAVLRMKADSSSVLGSRSRPRQPHGGGGLGAPDWPAFSSHPLSALSALGSQEDYRSEGRKKKKLMVPPTGPTLCLLLGWIEIDVFSLSHTLSLSVCCIQIRAHTRWAQPPMQFRVFLQRETIRGKRGILPNIKS